MAKTVKGTMYDGVRGAKVEFGTFTLDPDTINAGTDAETTLSFDGVVSGDQVFINPQQLDGYLVATGARVTGTDEIGVNLLNSSNTDNLDGSSRTYDYIAIKFSDS